MTDTETAVNNEAERWAQRLDWLHTEYGSDCSGVDSGDPLDCVELEIRQALSKLEAEVTDLTNTNCADCSDTGLKEDRGGRYFCTCITETDAFALLRQMYDVAYDGLPALDVVAVMP
jgi:hypothetical protein